MEPTSEQELKQLLEEGKITEEEYQELLEAIRQKETVQEQVEKQNEPKPRTGYGKAALILMIIGFLLPLASVVFNIVISMQAANGLQPKRMVMFTGCPFLFLGFLCLLLAFIFGIIGWKATSGKIAAIGVPCLGLLIIPGLVLLSLFHVRTSTAVAVEQAISKKRAKIEELQQLASNHLVSHKTYPMDTLEGLLSQGLAEIDKEVYVSGGGSLRIISESAEKRTIRLYETEPIDIKGVILIYSAQIKSALQDGRAYLEMWCDIPGKGEFFSRSIETPIMGTTEWTTVQTPFRLEHGQSPANVKLNLVIEGSGAVWVDDIKLSSSPLH